MGNCNFKAEQDKESSSGKWLPHKWHRLSSHE